MSISPSLLGLRTHACYFSVWRIRLAFAWSSARSHQSFHKSCEIVILVQVRGKDNPKPVKSWTQCGLDRRALAVLEKQKYTKPMPIQAQALPAIMSGRDCIGIAKTGSGKTLAFVLPMLRHIRDQVSDQPPSYDALV